MNRFFTLFVVFLLVATQLLFAGEFNFKLNGNGARAAGLGYAFTGIADDATAISWNPAGLTQLYSMEASVVGRLGFGSGSISGFEDLGIDSWEYSLSSNFQLNFASFIVPFNVGNLNVVGGVAYRKMYDNSREETQTLSDGIDEVEIYDKVSGGINAISPAIGVQFNDMISAGVTINILTGSEEGEGDVKLNGVVDPADEYNYSQDYSGTAIDIGVLIKPSDKFSIGATFNLPHTRTFEYHTDFFDSDPIDIDAPMFYNIGAAFRASDNLLLAFDYHGRPISDLEIEGNSIEGLNDLNSLHFGLEYLAESGNSVMPLRVGFYTDPTMLVDENEDQVVGNVFTAGIGFILDKIILDAGFEWAMYSFNRDLSYIFGVSDFVIEQSENDFRFTVGAVLHLGNN